jgi:hypothetical protein
MSNGIQSRYIHQLIHKLASAKQSRSLKTGPYTLALGKFDWIATNPLPSIIVRLYQTLAGEVAEWSKAHPC